MKQRGRKSAAALAVVTSIPGQRPPPPDKLTAEQAAVWQAVTAAKPATWFTADTWPLLVQYCRHAATVDMLQGRIDAAEICDAPMHLLDDLLKMRDRESKMLNTLARAMRLTQQAQRTPGNAGTESRRAAAAGPKPWQT